MRIGPRMAEAAAFVARNPGCCILDVGRWLNPRTIGKNNAYAYNPVHRAIKAGLIRAKRVSGRYSLTTP